MTDDVRLLTCSMGREQGGQQVVVAMYKRIDLRDVLFHTVG